tara:strand:+ start:1724 stop:2158 length:435 start_codon:yes stop_codon:yes gene_type:complete
MIKTIIIVAIMFSSLNVISQCSQVLLPEVIRKLADFTYTKDFQIKLKEVKSSRDNGFMTIPVMLNKGMKYRFVLDDAKELEGRMIFELHNDRGKRKLSSYVIDLDKHYSVLEFICGLSGMYFLNFEFKDTKAGCGVLVYGFKRE